MSSPRDPFRGSGGLPEVLWSSRRSLYGGELAVLDLLARETHGIERMDDAALSACLVAVRAERAVRRIGAGS